MMQRRDFILQTAGAAAGLALTGMGCNSTPKTATGGDGASGGRLNMARAFGIQLYTLRDDMPKDPKAVLKQLAGFGYNLIESYEGQMGMFWGMTNKEFRAYLDSLNLTIVSAHCNFQKDLQKKAADAAFIGMKYLVCPWLGPQKTLDDYKRYADEFNKAGEICKKEGIRFAYHNHDYSFKEVEGQLPQDVMMTGTDASLVDFEMDYYWVVTAGHSPEAWMKKYPDRFRLCHIKDRKKGVPATDTNASCNLGDGAIDFTAFAKAAQTYGMQYNLVEQERYDGTTPLKSAEANAKYMNKLVTLL
jgi:sugar phosphate isomerase/epimerase